MKYQLSDQDINSIQFPVGEEKSDGQMKDTQGNALVPMAGVTYRIMQVTPSNNTSDPFREVADFEPLFVATDTTGFAHVDLPEGIYKVSEQADDRINTPAQPIIVEVPQTVGGKIMNTLVIYPKSSVIKPDFPNTSNPEGPKGQSRLADSPNDLLDKSKLPNTSGSLGDITKIYYMIAAIVIIGIGSMIFLKPKKNHVN
ncbi:hypothetical protein RV18_GL003223 [Enterococcus termitis]|nr:hypothetical protein RV18_GL003223 [Enterococcus termitis]